MGGGDKWHAMEWTDGHGPRPEATYVNPTIPATLPAWVWERVLMFPPIVSGSVQEGGSGGATMRCAGCLAVAGSPLHCICS